ncbi:hypothetical protein DFH27DRAFT_612820 [Peziza echinospora]|nr:hypothetical protein DFH27DRAFT_612820 [Peziza echinospora]
MDADNQMRERFETLFMYAEIETLYGMCAMGSRPEEIGEDPERDTDDAAPEEGRWDIDILDPEGEKRVREVAAHIHAMCAGL